MKKTCRFLALYVAGSAATVILAVVISNMILGKPQLLRNDFYLLWILDGKDFFVPADAQGNMQTNPELVSLDNGISRFKRNKEKGVVRIFCVGGSVTAGWPFHQVLSYPHLMSLYLRDLLPGKRIEVINAGFQASDSANDLRIVNEIVNYEPDIIIASEGRTDSWNYPLHVSKTAFLAKLHVWLLRNVYVYGYVRRHRLHDEFNDAIEMRNQMERQCKYDKAVAGDYFAGNLNRMLAAARRRGSKLILLTQLVHSPETGNNVEFMRDVNRWLRDFSERNKDTILIDIDDAFRKSNIPENELIISCSGVHPDYKGYSLMARTVCRELAQSSCIAGKNEWVWSGLREDAHYFRQMGLTREFLYSTYRDRIFPLFRKLGLSPEECVAHEKRYTVDRITYE